MTYAQEGCNKQGQVTETDKIRYRRCRWCEVKFIPGDYYFSGYCQRCDDIRSKIKQEEIHAHRQHERKDDEQPDSVE